MKRLLWRIFTTTATWHFYVPLAVTIVLSTVLAIVSGARTPTAILEYLLHGPIWEILAIYLTFALVFGFELKKHTEARIANMGVLKDSLPGSSSYFAVSATPLHEWFDPAVQVYLATILGYRSTAPNFVHERVLLFFDEPSLDDVHLSFSEEYFAKCLNAIHREFSIPLAFLRASELFDVLDDLSLEDRDVLGWFPRRHKFRPRWLRRPRYVSANPRTMAFGVGYVGTQPTFVILFLKESEVLRLTSVNDPARMRPYVELATRIRGRIRAKDGVSLNRDHNFNEHMAM
jgi:hypothetical protein